MQMQPIPQCDPHASYLAQREAIDDAVRRALAGGRYILGPEVAAFEEEFANFIGARHALGVANGTDALALALRAAGVGPGDIVATVSHTAVATTVAIRSIGASPVFVDVDPVHGLMDTGHLEYLLKESSRGKLALDHSRIRAIVPVHLYGLCADLPAIMRIAQQHGLLVVEDCAQAHGAMLHGRAAGTWGLSASFSFYPTKNLGAFGDAGSVVTSDPDILERASLLRQYGWRTRYVSDIEGGNSRLDELHAAVLRVKLTRLAQGNAQRQAIAARYQAGLANAEISVPPPVLGGSHVYHQFVVRAADRDALRSWLTDRGVGTLVHYPCPVHLQPAYASPTYAPLPLPCTEAWASEVVSLPMFPELPLQDVDRVIDCVNAWMQPT